MIKLTALATVIALQACSTIPPKPAQPKPTPPPVPEIVIPKTEHEKCMENAQRVKDMLYLRSGGITYTQVKKRYGEELTKKVFQLPAWYATEWGYKEAYNELAMGCDDL